ncbi:MAG: SUMF1/EgtB/PvdO family nonheme iron enzyme [Bryobacterales bacterium]|nr:SUMF1/EgtB/PvdO family nonheme iron enzyme [Bryobacterales bacterium]
MSEWCQDYWSYHLPEAALSIRRDQTPGLSRVVRGGNLLSGDRSCRSAFRSLESTPNRLIGFRVVLSAPR